MSRIQNILEKAEREGATRRVRTLAKDAVVAAPAAPTTMDNAPVAMPIAIASAVAPAIAPLTADPAPASTARGQVVTGTFLDPRLVSARAPSATTAEQYRALRTRIVNADIGAAVKLVLVTSPGRAEGKTLTAANLALTMAQDFNRRVCVVDCNLREPQLHRVLGLTEGVGVTDVLAGEASLDEALVVLEEHQLSVLPAGSRAARPAELLGSMGMRRLVESLRSSFDRVVVDAPAALPLADVGILTPMMDAVVLVVRAGFTPRPAIAEAVSVIDEAKLLGVVLNGTSEA